MPKRIRYSFELPGNVRHDFSFSMNTDTFEIETSTVQVRPDWTKIDYCRCSHCPLVDQEYCPVATNICNIVLPMGSVISYETVTCRVETQERTSVTTTSAQDAVRSLMLFVIATSCCPHTDFLKPMARFHLPFITLEEAVSRIVSTYLLFQYFRKSEGHPFDQDLSGLREICRNFESIGVAMAERLRAEELKGDVGMNALVILHGFSQFLPMHIDSQLDVIRPAFEPILSHYDKCRQVTTYDTSGPSQ